MALASKPNTQIINSRMMLFWCPSLVLPSPLAPSRCGRAALDRPKDQASRHAGHRGGLGQGDHGSERLRRVGCAADGARGTLLKSYLEARTA
jgi:hypothetical protein